MLKDDQLVKDCLKNGKGAMDELYKRFAPKMFGVCLRYAKNRMEAEDFLQEGFIKVFLNLNTFRFDGSLEGWVRRIIVNTSINFYRQKGPWMEDVETSRDANSEVFNSDVVSDLSAQELLQYVQELPEGYRMVFNLYVVEGYLHKEIGEMLNISENTSKSQLAKARKALQEKIKSTVYEQAI
ncbi:MAG: sigma-70 family RNA polymerase sigma factor [Bacteroidia bacterium]|nr:sigma-70 family RNA polymerase sigma factor [Bacteroidia bacterium]